MIYALASESAYILHSTIADTSSRLARLNQRHRTARMRRIAFPFAAFPLALIIARSFSGRTLFISPRDN